MSKIADKVYDVLTQMYPPSPYKRIHKEIYVHYKGAKLFFDFFIRELGIFVEVQGEQHEKFVKHFHGDKAGLDSQRSRDHLKIQYVEEKGQCLIRFKYNEKITEELVKNKINAVLEGQCFNE
jgi:very-short-patch-repair endonuclease